MEQYFADAYYDVAGSPSAAGAFAVFVALLKLYNQTLAITTNWMAENERKGILATLLREEKRSAGKAQVPMITFNQDLVVENELYRLHDWSDWCMRSLYQLSDLEEIVHEDATPYDSLPFHGGGCSGHTSPFRLLKLHGSLNWVVRTVAKDPRPGTLFPGAGEKEVFLYTERYLDERGIRVQPAVRGKRPWYLWPLVVPPIYEKERITGMAVLRSLWRSASVAIERAERLVLIGYSLPDADVSARQMIRRALARNMQLECVDCVNPDPGVAVKFRNLTDCPVIRVFDSIDSYLGHVHS